MGTCAIVTFFIDAARVPTVTGRVVWTDPIGGAVVGPHGLIADGTFPLGIPILSFGDYAGHTGCEAGQTRLPRLDCRSTWTTLFSVVLPQGWEPTELRMAVAYGASPGVMEPFTVGSIRLTPVLEPATVTLLGGGLLVLGGLAARRRRRV